MRASRERIEVMAKFITSKWEREGSVTFQQSADQVFAQIADLVEKDFREEEAIYEEARKLLAQNRSKVASNIDEERALMMIVRQVAKEKGFTL